MRQRSRRCLLEAGYRCWIEWIGRGLSEQPRSHQLVPRRAGRRLPHAGRTSCAPVVEPGFPGFGSTLLFPSSISVVVLLSSSSPRRPQKMSSYGPPPAYSGVDPARGTSLILPYTSALDFNTGELEAALQLEDRSGARTLPNGVSLCGERVNGGFGSSNRGVNGTWVRSGGGGGGGGSGGDDVGGIRDEKGGLGGGSGRENRDARVGPLAHLAYPAVGHQATSTMPSSGMTYVVGAPYGPPEPMSSHHHLQHGSMFSMATGQAPTDRPGAVPSRLTPFSGGLHHPLSRPQQGPSPVMLNGCEDAWTPHPVASPAASAPASAPPPASSSMRTNGGWNPPSAPYMAYVTPPRRVVTANQSVPPLESAATAVSPQSMRRRAAPIAPSPSPPSASSGVPPSSPGKGTPSSLPASDPSVSPRHLSPRIGVAAGRCGGGGGGTSGTGTLSLQQERRLKNRMSAERYVPGVNEDACGGLMESRGNSKIETDLKNKVQGEQRSD